MEGWNLLSTLVAASEANERTLREVPLANRRLHKNCVPVSNECVYKRHYCKYSRNFGNITGWFRSGRQQQDISLCDILLEPSQTPAEFRKWSAHPRLFPVLYTLLTSFVYQYLCSSKFTLFRHRQRLPRNCSRTQAAPHPQP